MLPDTRWAPEVAEEWAQRLNADPELRMCLPTGRTPAPVYREVSKRGDFSQATIFLLDEFGLDVGDQGRCDEMLRRDLIAHLAEPPARLHGLDPQADDLRAECSRYEMLIAAGGLELTLLGLGANGHLGLNEPGSDPGSPTRVVELADTTAEGLDRYGAEGTTDWGLTIGLGRLLQSDEIWLLVTGEHKAGILEQTLKGPVSPEVPSSFLRSAENVVVWADESAASRL